MITLSSGILEQNFPFVGIVNSPNRLGDIKLDIQRKPIYYSLLELNGILLFVAQIIPQLPQLPQETKAGYEEIRQILAEEVII